MNPIQPFASLSSDSSSSSVEHSSTAEKPSHSLLTGSLNSKLHNPSNSELVFLTPSNKIIEAAYKALQLIPSETNCGDIYAKLKKKEAGDFIIDLSGGFFALNCAAIRRTNRQPKGILILTFSQKIANFWKDITPIIKNAKNRHTAIKQIEEKLFTCSYSYKNNVLFLTEDIERKFSWLSKTSKYNRVRQIFLDDCFIYRKVDFLDKEYIYSLSKFLSHSFTIDILHLSDRYQVEKANGQQGLRNLQEILWILQTSSMTDTTLVIDDMGGQQRARTGLFSENIVKSFPDDVKPLSAEDRKKIEESYSSVEIARRLDDVAFITRYRESAFKNNREIPYIDFSNLGSSKNTVPRRLAPINKSKT